MNRTERLYAITEELRAAGPRGRTSAWLAQRFEVSTRTIKRDAAALAEAGVPLWADEGRGGGYRLAPSASLPPLALTAGEATAIALALTAAPEAPFAADGRAALTKVLAAMPPAQRAEAAELAGRVWMRLPASGGRSRAARTLDEALRERVVARVEYEDAQGVRSVRRLEPLAFARTGGRWYLLAWCRDRAGGRWFRLDRVRAATATRERFAPRDVTAVFGTPPADAQPLHLDFSA